MFQVHAFPWVPLLALAPAVGPVARLQQPCQLAPQTEIVPTNLAAMDKFGCSLAISGDTAVLGAQGDDNLGGFDAGAAFVFVFDDEIWKQQAKLRAGDGGPDDEFGNAVAIEGDTVVVGASHDAPHSVVNEGSAYVFTRTGTTWSEQQKLLGDVPGPSTLFGCSVAISGDTILIGAEGEDLGAAYVFVFDGATWSQQAKLTEGSVLETDFGASVAVLGDWAIVGALRSNPKGVSGACSGLAWHPGLERLFSVSQDKLLEIDPASGVATLVGSIGFHEVEGLEYDRVTGMLLGTDDPSDQLITIDPSTGAGTAVGPTGFHQINGLALDPVSGTLYGVDSPSDHLVTIDRQTGAASAIGPVGTPEATLQGLAFDPASSTLYGSTIHDSPGWPVDYAHLYTIDPGTGMGTYVGSMETKEPLDDETVRGLAFDPESGTLYCGDTGALYTLDTATALATPVGNFWQTGAGAAHVFRRTGASWSQVQELEPPSGEAQEFGTSMAISGDTLVVGAPRQDQGSAYVYVLSGNTWTEQQRLTASDGETNDRFGDSVSVLGDAIVIGAPVGGNFVGSAYSFTRSGGTWHEEELFPAEVLTTAAQFGSSVAVAGAPGVLVGALEQDDSGAVYPLLMPPLPQVNYCTPGTSASGCQALLSATGNASASSPTGFTVQASAIEGSKDGVLFWGTNGRQAASWGNGTSYQCVVPPVTRAGPMVGVGTVGQCDGTFALDLNALWCPSCPKAHKNPGAGAVVQAQLWYRDPLNPSNQTTSLSDAIEFCVTP